MSRLHSARAAPREGPDADLNPEAPRRYEEAARPVNVKARGGETVLSRHRDSGDETSFLLDHPPGISAAR